MSGGGAECSQRHQGTDLHRGGEALAPGGGAHRGGAEDRDALNTLLRGWLEL